MTKFFYRIYYPDLDEVSTAPDKLMLFFKVIFCSNAIISKIPLCPYCGNSCEFCSKFDYFICYDCSFTVDIDVVIEL